MRLRAGELDPLPFPEHSESLPHSGHSGQVELLDGIVHRAVGNRGKSHRLHEHSGLFGSSIVEVSRRSDLSNGIVVTRCQYAKPLVPAIK